jgi:hypothetical protein
MAPSDGMAVSPPCRHLMMTDARFPGQLAPQKPIGRCAMLMARLIHALEAQMLPPLTPCASRLGAG